MRIKLPECHRSSRRIPPSLSHHAGLRRDLRALSEGPGASFRESLSRHTASTHRQRLLSTQAGRSRSPENPDHTGWQVVHQVGLSELTILTRCKLRDRANTTYEIHCTSTPVPERRPAVSFSGLEIWEVVEEVRSELGWADAKPTTPPRPDPIGRGARGCRPGVSCGARPQRRPNQVHSSASQHSEPRPTSLPQGERPRGDTPAPPVTLFRPRGQLTRSGRNR